jgi:4-diphosphocytidyl-2-C-methyl-D-erythritol kinase
VAPAKINLYLEIIGDRPDGYHELVMVMQSISLADQIDLQANGTEQFRVHCDHPEVPNNQTNLAYRAAELMAKEFPSHYARYGAVDITLHKHIPIGAGLAGGSGNAAAVLVGIDHLWNLGLIQSDLQELGARLGSDIPFCISGGTALATGRGEVLDTLPDLDHLYVVLAKYRNLSVSTAWAYATYRQRFGNSYPHSPEELEQRRHQLRSGNIIKAIAHRNAAEMASLLHNDLEKVVLPAYPKVATLRETCQHLHPLGTVMSGSGPTIFALVESQQHAEVLCQSLHAAIPDPDLESWVAQLCTHGVHLDD